MSYFEEVTDRAVSHGDAGALVGAPTPTGRLIIAPEDYVVGADDGRWLASRVSVDLEEAR